VKGAYIEEVKHFGEIILFSEFLEEKASIRHGEGGGRRVAVTDANLPSKRHSNFRIFVFSFSLSDKSGNIFPRFSLPNDRLLR